MKVALIAPTLWILISMAGISHAEKLTCDASLKSTLGKMASGGPVSIARRIESGELTLKRIENQGVYEVGGLPRNDDYIVRFDPFESRSGEESIRILGFNARTRIKRDFATALIDRELGTNLVPETLPIQIHGKEYSLQKRVYGMEFKSGEQYSRYLSKNLRTHPEAIAKHKADLESLAVFDLVIGNTDRNITNFIYDASRNRIWAIDNVDAMPILEKAPSALRFWMDYSRELRLPMNPGTRSTILSINAERISAKLKAQGLIEPEAIKLMEARIKFMKDFLHQHPACSLQDMTRGLDAVFFKD